MKPARQDDEKLMREALRLAAEGRGRVEPNPMVGAVVARDDGRVVASGRHAAFGGPHAEAAALADCAARGIDPEGLTMAVTLEPCSHHGKTPPCAEALIEARLARIVVAMVDPFEQVAGRGIAMLREAGIEVAVGVCETEAKRLNEAYLKRIATGLPWVIVKWASTLDGKIAARTGDSKWISNEASRRRVHELRARVDAIMTGIGTVLADDPQLTARGVDVKRVARRVVVDPRGELPENCRLARAGDVLVSGGDVEATLRRLAQEGATNVLVEAGGGLTGDLLAYGLVDQVLAFVCPKLLGDAQAIDPVRGLEMEKIAEAIQLELRGVEQIGQDVLLDYRVRR